MPMFRRSLFVLLAIALIAIGVTAFTLSKEDTVQPLAAGTAPAAETVTVYVTGAVRRPGVVTLAGGRIEQAITACGGALPDADLARINLAQPLKDGMQIEVPGALRENLSERDLKILLRQNRTALSISIRQMKKRWRACRGSVRSWRGVLLNTANKTGPLKN